MKPPCMHGEQQHGTAELVFVTPSNKLAWLLGKMMGNLIFSIVTFFTLLLFGAALFGYYPKAPPNIPLAIVGILLTMIALMAFGFVFAGICFMAKREHELSQVLWPVMVLFSGLAFPITNFPLWWKIIAWMIPVTHGVEITRNALLLGSSFSDPNILFGLRDTRFADDNSSSNRDNALHGNGEGSQEKRHVRNVLTNLHFEA